MKTWMNVCASMTLAALGGVALAANAYGQDRFQAVPTNCIINVDEIALDDGRNFTSSGTMDLSPGEVSPPDEPVEWMRLTTAGFNAQSNDPELGTVTWQLDDSRPVTTSILQSNQAGASFPATVRLDFNVRATISSQPGRVYLSRNPVSIGNENITNWPPGETQLNLVAGADGGQGVIEFYPEDDPSAIGFRVIQLSSRVRD